MTIKFDWRAFEWETYCTYPCCAYENYMTWPWWDFLSAYEAYKTW